MTEMLELPDTYFKAVIIKCFNAHAWNKWKNTLLKETENIKKPMEILELENVLTKIKNEYLKGWAQQWNVRTEKSMKLKIEKQKLFHLNKEKIELKMNKT